MLTPTLINAHCQIPCGIYNDELRFTQLHEHITTLEKSITTLTNSKNLSENQKVRWVLNKETHADAFTDILHDYFLTQRIKPLTNQSSKSDIKRHTKLLALIHELTVLSMKTKQTTEIEHTTQLHRKLEIFKKHY